MKRLLHAIWLWIKNAFISGQPNLSLDYADYVIESKSYFVFTWKIKNAYCLRIKSAGFKSFLKSGSAYTALPENNDQLEIKVSGSWKSQKYLIKLKRMALNGPLDFPVAMNNSFTAQPILPSVEPRCSGLKIDSLNVHLADRKQIRAIINISYPN